MREGMVMAKQRPFKPKYPCLRPAGGSCIEAGGIKCPALKRNGVCPLPQAPRAPRGGEGAVHGR